MNFRAGGSFSFEIALVDQAVDILRIFEIAFHVRAACVPGAVGELFRLRRGPERLRRRVCFLKRFSLTLSVF